MHRVKLSAAKERVESMDSRKFVRLTFRSGLRGTVCVVGMLLMLITAAYGQDPTTGSQALKVVTYNIRLNTPRDGENRWEVRKPRTYELIRRMKPDVLGLQEVLKDQLDDLKQEFPGFAMIGAGRSDGKDGGEFSNLMYKTARLKELKSDTFWLSDTPEVAGSTSWGNRLTRICTWALFEDKATGERFYLFNTHLDHQSQPSREKSAELIVQRIKDREPKAPVILTGDFNAHETNVVVDTIKKAGFRDTFRVVHPDAKEVGTTNAFSPNRMPAKIDFIFVDDNWKVLDAEIRDDRIDDHWPSDHLPVTATVKLAK